MTTAFATEAEVQEVANALVRLCREGRYEEAMNTLYAENAVHVEAYSSGGKPERTEGLQALQAAGKEWEETFETHSSEISEPLLAAGCFAIRMKCDTTHKPSGQRMPLEELCVYQVENGKITQVNFFYPKMDYPM
jgi:ketosteroid isomerase-like protein